MERRAWTARGVMQEEDKSVIAAISDKNKVAARIFVTGEVHESYIGDMALRLLIGVNDTLYKGGVAKEPLFVETKQDTVRMTRFDPAAVWRCFHPDTLVKLAEEEADRLHVNIDPWGMECFDFYEEMIRSMRMKDEYSIPVAWKDSEMDDYYNAVYLSCLLLFDKPGYLDIPVAEHFAQPKVAKWLASADFRKLTAPEIGKLVELKGLYNGIQALTNPELNFIVDLYERGRRGSTVSSTFKRDEDL